MLKEKQSSNHQFSGAMLVSGKVCSFVHLGFMFFFGSIGGIIHPKKFFREQIMHWDTLLGTNISPPRQFWRWFAFSQGGICDRSLEGTFQRWNPSPPRFFTCLHIRFLSCLSSAKNNDMSPVGGWNFFNGDKIPTTKWFLHPGKLTAGFPQKGVVWKIMFHFSTVWS